jgi:photosystem II stability/assembly factor-like uncharacterized protein
MTYPASLLALLLSVAAVLSAETPRWTRATPFGGDIVALTQAASSPQMLYAATARQVYGSTNGGVAWSLRTPPLQADEIILDAVADPLHAPTLYLRTSAGLLRTRDRGVHWVRVGAGLPAGKTVVPDRSQPGVLWAATPAGLYRSADRGDTWQLALGGSQAAFAIAALAPDTFFLATIGDPLFSPLSIRRSTDHGATWETTSSLLLLSGGLPGEPGFAFDAVHPGTLYVFLQNGSFEALYRTADLGANWALLALIPPGGGVNDLASTPDGVLFGATDLGVLQSTDQGTTWSPPLPSFLAVPRDRIARLLASAALPKPLLAAGSGGLWASGDGGASWRNSSRGIVAQEVAAVLASPVGPPTLTTAAGGSVYHSVDEGTTWTRLHVPAQGWRLVRLAAHHPLRPSTLYGIASRDRTEILLKSTDGGRSWVSIALPFPCPSGVVCEVKIEAVTPYPQSPENVFVAGFVPLPQGGGPFLVHSDEQQPWTLLEGSPHLTGLTADPDRAGTLYGLTCQGLFKSLDAGVSWRQVGSNLPASVCATALALDPRDTRRLWVGTAGRGLFFSADGGETFQASSRGLAATTIGTLLFDPDDPSRVYAGVADRGIYRWSATQRRWVPLPDPGLPVAGFLGVLTLDPQNPSVLYAAHPQHGIFRLRLEE